MDAVWYESDSVPYVKFPLDPVFAGFLRNNLKRRLNSVRQD